MGRTGRMWAFEHAGVVPGHRRRAHRWCAAFHSAYGIPFSLDRRQSGVFFLRRTRSEPPLTAEPGMFEFRNRWYLLMGIELAEYRNSMRRRSVKWETVALPAEGFRSLARPIESWL